MSVFYGRASHLREFFFVKLVISHSASLTATSPTYAHWLINYVHKVTIWWVVSSPQTSLQMQHNIRLLTPSASSTTCGPTDASVLHLQEGGALDAHRLCALNLHSSQASA